VTSERARAPGSREAHCSTTPSSHVARLGPLAEETTSAVNPLPRDIPWLRDGIPALVVGTLVYLATWPVLALLHELLVVFAAQALSSLEMSAAWAALSEIIPLDPIYTATPSTWTSDSSTNSVPV
jgi:hypothetical protein